MIRALASRSITVNELAEEFSITRRQVYRDLEGIEEQGHSVGPKRRRKSFFLAIPVNWPALLPQTAVHCLSRDGKISPY
jgi:hypothetical protein